MTVSVCETFSLKLFTRKNELLRTHMCTTCTCAGVKTDVLKIFEIFSILVAKG